MRGPERGPSLSPEVAPRSLELFAGAGGLSVGGEDAGAPSGVGIEMDEAAARTRTAAGFPTIVADVATYPVEPFVGRVTALTGGPPCPTYSNAGNGKGREQLGLVLAAVERCRDGWTDAALAAPWSDPRTPLVLQPLRWASALRPEWLVMEQVPGVLPIWEAMADVLERWGYRADTRVLCAADYGVPQTRERAFLAATCAGPVRWPLPTHHRQPQPQMFGPEPLPWVTMAEALGWGEEMRGYVLDRRQDGAAVVDPWKQPSPTLTTQACGGGVWRIRPRASVVQGPRCEYVRGQDYSDALPLTLADGAKLQGFPAEYPWNGTRREIGQQIGNAVPPQLAAAVIGALTGRQQTERRAA